MSESPESRVHRRWLDHGIAVLEHYANGTMEEVTQPPGRDRHYHDATDACVSCDAGETERWDLPLKGPGTEET